MAKKVIVIDGYIGPLGYSKQFMKQMLVGAEKDDVEINVSSLGGAVDDALNMHDQIATQGRVTIVYTGFNASSATLMGLGASKITISENSFYLIHKVMSWIDEFGLMNEDDLDVLIQRLEKEKNENAKITLQIASMYSKKTGKPIQAILNLMKEETWLTADEAKTWGFVDEVFAPGVKENILEDVAKVAMVMASGFPSPQRKTNDPILNQADEDTFFNKILTRLKQAITTPNKQPMKKQFLNLNKVIKVEKLESTEEGIFLNEEQLEAIDTKMTEANTAETDRDTARTELSNALTSLDSIDPTVVAAKTAEDKVKAIQNFVAKKPGANSAGVHKETDDNGGEGEEEGASNFFSAYNSCREILNPK